MKRLLFTSAAALLATSATAATLFSEDFESYTAGDNAAMVSAGNWDGSTYPNTSAVTTAQAHAGTKSYVVTSGDTGMTHAGFTPFTPSTSEQLRVTFWWRPTASGTNSREGFLLVGTDSALYTGTKLRQLAFGGYSTTNDNYYTRAVGTGADSAWTKSSIAKTAAWHQLTIEVGTTSNANKARFFVDGVLAADRPINAGAYNAIKIGSNAGDATSATGTTYFDDILVETATGVPVSMSGLWID